ncbi:dTMP kinase [Myxococcota bacterium]|nr:dTMP kinase [Myxococcota bacterium]
MKKGLLIALEGIDGSGTTTQVALLADWLRDKGHTVHTTAEPSTLPIGKLIRQILRGEEAINKKSLALLFAADRLDHIEREITPKLDAGTIVITDRFILSSLAYQGLDNPGDWIRQLNKYSVSPDISILLRISAKTSAKRRAVRGEAAEIFDADKTQEKLVDAYDEAFENNALGPVAIVDGEGPRDTVFLDLAHLLNGVINLSTPDEP